MNNVTDFTSIRASAVPAVPRTISATQRLAALELAQFNEDFMAAAGHVLTPLTRKLFRDNSALLRELAGDAKGERES